MGEPTMEECMTKTQDDYGSRIARPKFDEKARSVNHDELSDLEEKNVDEENEITELFKIKADIFHFETPLCKAFKDFNYLLLIDYKWYEELDNGELKDEALNNKSTLEGLMKVEEESRANNDDEIQENRECFDEHESMENKDDDIGDLGVVYLKWEEKN
uniref:Uncharacterized protein n=1 Tax=Tanacetum cinerariifolium TaxID=118510 RepID=A0A699I3A2_TANCI|nr:hypothetical protein [Tanacetum cinerariifolium]